MVLETQHLFELVKALPFVTAEDVDTMKERYLTAKVVLAKRLDEEKPMCYQEAKALVDALGEDAHEDEEAPKKVTRIIVMLEAECKSTSSRRASQENSPESVRAARDLLCWLIQRRVSLGDKDAEVEWTLSTRRHPPSVPTGNGGPFDLFTGGICL